MAGLRDRCGDRWKDHEVVLMFYLYTCFGHEFFVLVKERILGAERGV